MVRRILAAAFIATVASAATAEPGKWTVTRKTSLVDQSVDYTAKLEAENDVAGILETPERPVLTASCGRDGMFLMIEWPDFVEKPSFDSLRTGVTWGLDGAKPETLGWIATTKAVVFQGREAKAMLAKLATVKRIAVRVPDRHGTQEAAFTLEGIAAVAADVGPMRCG